MADVYRGRPASAVWEAGMGGNEPHHQVLFKHYCRILTRLFALLRALLNVLYCCVTDQQLFPGFQAPSCLWEIYTLAPGPYRAWYVIQCLNDLVYCCFAQHIQVGDICCIIFLCVQDIPFFFTLQNSSHVVSYIILKVVHREVRACAACWM